MTSLLIAVIVATCCCFCSSASTSASSFDGGGDDGIHPQPEPTISGVSPPSPFSARVGSTVEMDCTVLHAIEYPILWVKLPKNCSSAGDFGRAPSGSCSSTPLSSGSALIVRDRRFSMRYDTASSTFTLRIENLRKEDEGVYQCQIIVQINNKVTRHVDLSVTQPPSVFSPNASRTSLSVKEGSPAEIVCLASGYPAPTVSWRRLDGELLPTGGVLQEGQSIKILRAKKAHKGAYECVAENGVGRPVRRIIDVEVEFPPAVRVTGDSHVGQAFGYSLVMSCHVEAHPAPTISWVHDGIRLSSNQVYAVDTGFDRQVARTSVRIKKLDKRQVGVYHCRAENKLGSDEGTIHIVHQYEPNCVVGLCDVDFAGSGGVRSTTTIFLAVLLTWTALLM